VGPKCGLLHVAGDFLHGHALLLESRRDGGRRHVDLGYHARSRRPENYYAKELGSFLRRLVALAHEEDKNREQNGQRAGAKNGYSKKDLMHEAAPVRSGGSKCVSQSPVVAEGDAVMNGRYLMSGIRHNLQ